MELKDLLEKQNKAFAEFKEANDARLGALEAKGSVDPLLEEKVDKANAEITRLSKLLGELEAKAKRPRSLGDAGLSDEAAEHKEAFLGFIRKGREDGLRELEQKALNVTTGSDGGFAVPEELDRMIIDLVQDGSPMRQECNVVQVGSGDYKKLVNVHGTGSGWVDEDDTRAETTSPALAQVAAVMGEIYANAYATQTALDDIFFGAEQWLAAEIGAAFALAENTAFTSGDGTKKPKGFLAYATAATADATRAFGTIEHIATGGSGAFKTASASVSPADDLVTAIYKLKAGLRTGAKFMMNSTVLAGVRKWKAYGTGDYLWQPSTVAGQPSTLLGYPVVENEDMPAVAANALAIAFGNFKRAYTIVDRFGVRLLRDPYSAKPYVTFYATKRVGGMLVDSTAVKVIKLASS